MYQTHLQPIEGFVLDSKAILSQEENLKNAEKRKILFDFGPMAVVADITYNNDVTILLLMI